MKTKTKISLTIPTELYLRLKKHNTQLNWSAIAAKALEDALNPTVRPKEPAGVEVRSPGEEYIGLQITAKELPNPTPSTERE